MSNNYVVCRRNTPQMSGNYGVWPTVRGDNWCGEWKAWKDVKTADKPVLTLPKKK